MLPDCTGTTFAVPVLKHGPCWSFCWGTCIKAPASLVNQSPILCIGGVFNAENHQSSTKCLVNWVLNLVTKSHPSPTSVMEENRTWIQTATGTGIAKVGWGKTGRGNFRKGRVVVRAVFGEEAVFDLWYFGESWIVGCRKGSIQHLQPLQTVSGAGPLLAALLSCLQSCALLRSDESSYKRRNVCCYACSGLRSDIVYVAPKADMPEC